jgi:hypothetical protein
MNSRHRARTWRKEGQQHNQAGDEQHAGHLRLRLWAVCCKGGVQL